ncbi:MAG: VWA domain-containing protein [Candidatus Competibacteraceae bacterium]|nr:MAG: VWA domain-containing protein [Candidatus Competibacteraceae bacterium]
MTDQDLPFSLSLPRSTESEVARFLRAAARTPVAAQPRGRLIFALDATASRQPTWDRACQWQGDMFAATAEIGGLALQLVWYRGHGEFQVEPWLTDSADLKRRMTSVQCRGGLTQIGRVLEHATRETRLHRVNALVLVGDCLEEPVDPLCHQAGQLGLLGVPAFVFQEGNDSDAALGFREIARLAHGAYCVFDSGSARQLRELLAAVAVYAAGGRPALEEFSRHRGDLIRQLTRQI